MTGTTSADFRVWQHDYEEGVGKYQGAYLILQTYVGGPSGGYILYYDGTLYAWRQDWGTGKVQETQEVR